MSYMIEKFNEGEVHMRDYVCGWYFEETNEFRPLMNDAMQELCDAGLVTQAHVVATAKARSDHEDETLRAYIDRELNRTYSDEEKFEMRSAFGPGETVVNVITGKRIKL